MKSSSLALLSAMALAVAPLGAVPAAAAPTRVVEIAFDGFCDGMSINIPSSGLGTRFTVDGTGSGCEPTSFFGRTGPRDARPPAPADVGPAGIVKGSAYITNPTYDLMYVIRPDQSFAIYGLIDSVINELLVGTWSFGPPTEGASAANSTAATAAAAAEDAPTSPAAETELLPTLRLSFDGYCDGLRLISPSVGTGVKGTVDGAVLGCERGQLFGALTKIHTQKRTYVVEWVNGTGLRIQTAVYPDHTFLHYALTGDHIVLAGSGTWTEGPPSPGQTSSASSS